LEVEPNDSVEDDQYYVCADTGIVVHNCHPRDNIALRWMAEQLGLGYDLFDSIMHSREVQAENMAAFLVNLAKPDTTSYLFNDHQLTPTANQLWPDAYNKNRQTLVSMPIVIIGKAYKPLVPYDDGSSSMLVGHYAKILHDQKVYFYDGCMQEYPPDDVLAKPCVYLIAHDPDITYGTQLDDVREFMKGRNISEADHAFDSVGGMDRIPAAGSIMVDPWRKVTIDDELGIRVIYYGNTRADSPR